MVTAVEKGHKEIAREILLAPKDKDSFTEKPDPEKH